MRGNLGVRINDGVNDRTVTHLARGLKFSKKADGGHQAASFTITTPLGTFTDLGPSDRAYLYDTRTGAPIWEGYTEAPTPVSGPGGEAYGISALGGMIRAADETRALIYLDKNLDGWEDEPNSSSAGSSQDIKAPVTPGKRLMFSGGEVVANAALFAIGYRRITNAGMTIGGVHVYSGSGKDDTGYRLEMFADGAGSGLFLIGDSGKITTVPLDQSFYSGNTYIRSPDAALQPFSGSRVAFQIRRVGAATNIADDKTYSDVVGLTVIGQRMTRYGALITGSALAPATSVYAYQVVEDLLGRLLTFCDPNTSSVETTAFVIDQLAYPDGATAQRVLDDLGDFEPDYLWEFLHSTSGGHVFNYRRWPTDPRYEITTADGYVESGADADLCNRIAVSWTDETGNPQTTIVTATSDTYPALKALEDVGRTRDADPIALPDGTGSLSNARALGAAILADKAGQPTPARAVVRRPLRDLYTGAMVMPWEIEPGYVVRVRDKGLDLRLTSMEYDDDSCSTSLELGNPSPTRDQRIAALARA